MSIVPHPPTSKHHRRGHKRSRYHLHALFIALIVLILAYILFWPAPTQGHITERKINRGNFVSKGERYEDGKNHALFPKHCSKAALRQTIWRDQSIQQFFDRCSDHLKVRAITHPLLKYIRNRYPYTDDRSLSLLTFNLRDGSRLRGIFVHNQLSTPSPLVIIKGGIYADVIFEGSPNNLLLQYAQEAPFNALYLESTTSKEYIRTNKGIAFGGLIESAQLAEVLYELEHSKYSSLISEVHLVGNSLGGNGVLLIEKSLYEASAEGLGISSRLYPRSLTAHCPVINLKKSFAAMFSTTLAGILGTRYLRYILDDIRYDVPLIYNLFGNNDLRDYERPILQDVMQKVNAESYRKFYQRRYGTDDFDMERDLYRANDVSDYVTQLKIPTYIIHAKNDHIVRYKDNLGLLLQKRRHQLPKHVQTLALDRGDHCAYGHAYNWGHITTLYKTIIYRHSQMKPKQWYYNIKSDFNRTARTIFGNPSIRFKPGDAIANYYFKKYKEGKGYKLKFKIFRAARDQGHCRSQAYYNADSACYDIESVYIRAQTLRRNPPRDSDEENALIRRLNSQAILVNSSGLDVRGRASLPVELIVER